MCARPRPPQHRNTRSRHRRAVEPESEPAAPDSGAERLQKVMAAAGVGSRRHCEELIKAGRVEVDGRVVRELGTKVDPHRHEIRVNGEPLARPRRVYYLVNKPIGVVSTNYDPSGRPRVIDLLPPTSERLFTVGRLDLSSEGLILLTNDGELANKLAHPRYGVEKTYHALVAGKPEPEVLDQLRRGVRLAEAWARAASVRVKVHYKQSTLLEIVLTEGRNREIRRILAKVGHKVLRLKRVAMNGIRLKALTSGGFRPLRPNELKQLRAGAKLVYNRATRQRPSRSALEQTGQPPGLRTSEPRRHPTEGVSGSRHRGSPGQRGQGRHKGRRS